MTENDIKQQTVRIWVEGFYGPVVYSITEKQANALEQEYRPEQGTVEDFLAQRHKPIE
ncbi:MAG: hypothetical protein ACLQDV_15110 [Candidatus Binataceae bacterium]